MSAQTTTTTSPDTISSQAQLRALYGPAGVRSVAKEISFLDPHCQRYIALSPFVVLASSNAAGDHDATPRGGDAGFVKVPDPTTLLIPDASGNNRLDTLSNIVATSRIALLFMLPGVDETLRVNGRAVLSLAETHLALFAADKKPPKLVIAVTVEAAYLHCAKAFMRSRLWDPATLVKREVLPSMGEMLRDQTRLDIPAETQAEMLERYRSTM